MLDQWAADGVRFTGSDVADHFEMSKSWGSARIKQWRAQRAVAAAAA
jgi:hypothetical protein